MKTTVSQTANQQIAKRESSYVNKVRREIEIAIKEAYKNSETHEKWTELFGEGNIPTPEEFISIVADEIKNKNNNF